MNMLEKFKNKQLDAQSMKKVKGGHEATQWWDCVDETGHTRYVAVNYGESLADVVDGINGDSSEYAIVGCESSPNGGW